MFNIKKIEKLEDNKSLNLMNLKLRKFAMKSLIIARLVYPYVISSGVVIGAASLLGSAPFIRDTHTEVLHQDGTLNNLGDGKISSYYDSSKKSQSSTIKYTSKWSRSNNGSYERIIKTYKLENVDLDAISKQITSPKTINNLEDIFGKCTLQEKEIKAQLTDEELSSPEMLEATVFSVDTGDVISVKETVKKNVITTVVTLIMAIAATLLTMYVRVCELFGYDLDDARDDLNYENRTYQKEAERILGLKK